MKVSEQVLRDTLRRKLANEVRNTGRHQVADDIAQGGWDDTPVMKAIVAVCVDVLSPSIVN